MDKKDSSRRNMTTAALILGAASIATFQFFFLSVPLGALALILAFLGKGGRPFEMKGKIAAIAAAVGIIVSSAVTGYAFYSISTDPQFRSQVEELYEYYMKRYGLGDELPDSSDSDPNSVIEEILSDDFRRGRDSEGSGSNGGSGTLEDPFYSSDGSSHSGGVVI